jgi:hypothetical protein
MRLVFEKNSGYFFKKMPLPAERVFGRRVVCGNLVSGLSQVGKRRKFRKAELRRRARVQRSIILSKGFELGLDDFARFEILMSPADYFRVNSLNPFCKVGEILAKSQVKLVANEKPCIDDTLSRAHIWKTLFGDEPMPEIEEHAAEKYSGTLKFPENFDFDKIARKVKKGW